MNEVNARGQTLEEFLAAYDETQYRRPSNTVDMILMTISGGSLKILLVKRKDHHFIHDWALPGGFINFDEDMETAVQRELAEETNITDHTYFKQLYTFGNADRDPRTRIITTAYLSMTPEENIRNTAAGDDAEERGRFTISKITVHTGDEGRESVIRMDLPEKNIHMIYDVTDSVKSNYVETRSVLNPDSNARLACDHIKAINMAMDQLQHRAASTGILFNMLPEEFTLRQAQTVYEAIIGRTTDTGNFRRDIRKMLKATGKKCATGGKAAELFRFNPLYSFLEEKI